jgi:hypothetical protein
MPQGVNVIEYNGQPLVGYYRSSSIEGHGSVEFGHPVRNAQPLESSRSGPTATAATASTGWAGSGSGRRASCSPRLRRGEGSHQCSVLVAPSPSRRSSLSTSTGRSRTTTWRSRSSQPSTWTARPSWRVPVPGRHPVRGVVHRDLRVRPDDVPTDQARLPSGRDEALQRPIIGGQTFVDTLRAEGAEVWLTTTRPHDRFDRVDPDTREWCRRNGINFDGLLYDGDKMETARRHRGRQSGSSL